MEEHLPVDMGVVGIGVTLVPRVRTQRDLDELLALLNPDMNVQSQIDNGYVKIGALSILCIGLLSFLTIIYMGVMYIYGIKWATDNHQREGTTPPAPEVELSSEIRSTTRPHIIEKVNPLEVINNVT